MQQNERLELLDQMLKNMEFIDIDILNNENYNISRLTEIFHQLSNSWSAAELSTPEREKIEQIRSYLLKFINITQDNIDKLHNQIINEVKNTSIIKKYSAKTITKAL